MDLQQYRNDFALIFKEVDTLIPLWETLDSTKLQAYAACPRAYYYEYVLGYRQDPPSNHLVFGQAWHEALEHMYRTDFSASNLSKAFSKFLDVYRPSFPEATDELVGAKTPQNAIKALAHYAQTYAFDHANWHILDTEKTYHLPYSANEKDTIVVKLDMIVKDRNSDNPKISIVEHKTAGSFSQTWKNQWYTSLQISAYSAALRHLLNFDDDMPVNVIVNGTAFSKTKIDFCRLPIIRTAVALENYRMSVMDLILRLETDFDVLAGDCIAYRSNTKNETMRAFLQNPISCTRYFGCPYFDFCDCCIHPLRMATYTSPPSGFRINHWNPQSQGE